MNDDFMNSLKRDPRSGFAEELREQLRADEADAESQEPAGRGRRAARMRPLLAAAAAVAVVVAFSVSPPLRASAQAFLDLFRVRNFVAVTVDPARLEQLHSKNLDLKGILGDSVEQLQKPGEPQVFRDPAQAAAAAGIALRVPNGLPSGFTFDTLLVQGEGAARVTIHARKLQEVLNTLGMSDIRLPAGLEGAQATFRMPHAVVIPLKGPHERMALIQARSPEIQLPPGVDIRQLGEIGLRIMGMDESDARQFAANIDWRTTLLVPVPSDASSFRQVSVRGARALLITTTGSGPGAGPRHRRGSVLMWSEGEKVFAIVGQGSGENELLVANSLGPR